MFTIIYPQKNLSVVGLTKGKIEETVHPFFQTLKDLKESSQRVVSAAWLGLAATALFKGHGDVAITCYHRQIRSNK